MIGPKILVDGKECEIIKISYWGNELLDEYVVANEPVISYVVYYQDAARQPRKIKVVFYNPYKDEWSTTILEKVNVEFVKENVYA